MPDTAHEKQAIRWGIIGAGAIAATVARDIEVTFGNVVHGVAARDRARARAFADALGVRRHYSDYEELVADDDIDVVYIATTHPHHRRHALLAIEAGKHVLVEKPAGLNALEAQEMFEAATQRGVFAMEAMWMRLNPLVRMAHEFALQGAIGEVLSVRHEFGLGMPFDPEHRLYDRSNGGGALLDLCIYPINFAHLMLGPPDEVTTVGALAPTGVDETVAQQWLFAGVPRAQLWASISVHAPNQAAVLGTDGWMLLEAPSYRPSGLVINDRLRTYRIDDPLLGHGVGYGPQIEEVARCIRAGLLESPFVRHDDTVAVLRILDRAREALGVSYPNEETEEPGDAGS